MEIFRELSAFKAAEKLAAADPLQPWRVGVFHAHPLSATSTSPHPGATEHLCWLRTVGGDALSLLGKGNSGS